MLKNGFMKVFHLYLPALMFVTYHSEKICQALYETNLKFINDSDWYFQYLVAIYWGKI